MQVILYQIQLFFRYVYFDLPLSHSLLLHIHALKVCNVLIGIQLIHQITRSYLTQRSSW